MLCKSKYLLLLLTLTLLQPPTNLNHVQAESVTQVYNMNEQSVSGAGVIIKTANTSVPQYKVSKQVQRRSNPANLSHSCVNYAHAVVGIKQPIGLAKNQPMNSKTPTEGAIVVTNESSAGHLAIITEVREDGIVLKEANYTHGKITEGRFLAFDSGRIRGYFLPPNQKTD
jgi:hypothetical protein